MSTENTTTASTSAPNANVNAGNVPTADKASGGYSLGSLASYKTDPLGENNWMAWKIRITTILSLHEVSDHVINNDVASCDPKQATAEWKKKENIAKTLLQINIGDDQMIHIAECEMAKQIWDNLKAIHEIKGQQSIIAMKRTLYKTQITKDAEVPAHMTEMKNIRAKLHAMGCRIPDGEFMNVLLSSLPHSWNGFIATYMGARTGSEDAGHPKMSMQEMLALLGDEYNRRTGGSHKTKRDSDNTNEHVFQSEQKGKRRKVKPEKKKENLHCTICDRNGHAATDCYYRGKPKCGNCALFGHLTKDCRKPGGAKFKGKQRQTNEGQVEETCQACMTKDDEPIELAFVATDDDDVFMAGDNDDKPLCYYSWLADTAASSHITNNRAAFTDYTSLHTHVSGIGRQPADVQGCGTVHIRTTVSDELHTVKLTNVLHVPTARHNILSIGRLDEAGGRANTSSGTISLLDKNNKVFATGKRANKIYYLHAKTELPEQAHNVTDTPRDWLTWHLKFGHIGV